MKFLSFINGVIFSFIFACVITFPTVQADDFLDSISTGDEPTQAEMNSNFDEDTADTTYTDAPDAGVPLRETDAGVSDQTFMAICDRVNDPKDKIYGPYPSCAATPADCITTKEGDAYLEPVNCMYLEEPIGGEPGRDLFRISCHTENKTTVCEYILWYGEAIVGDDRGPVQALLTYTPGLGGGDMVLGPITAYLKLFYNFTSGVIVSFVILLVIIGGIRMTVSHGDPEEFRKGRAMITKAITGMALWFLASLILYTINPTFFTF
jgi:hypothetical protein